MINERFKISKIILLVLVFVLGFVLVKTTFSNNAVKTNNEKDVELMSGLHHVVISVKDLGDIKLELDADMAPITVTNFLKLVNDKFYDGLTFHRIIKGFMIQGGDPTGTGFGGSNEKIKGEFISNGVNNTISHVRGTISMARSKHPDTGSSQFFIVQNDAKYLDGDYAGFGHVTEGMEVVDKVVDSVQGKTGRDGEVEAKDQPVITSITQID